MKNDDKKTVIYISLSVGSARPDQLCDTDRVFVDPHQVSWATRFGTKFREYSDKYNVECWKLYDAREEITKWRYFDPNKLDEKGIYVENAYGVVLKVFPAKKIGPINYSKAMESEIKSRMKNEDILLHLQSAHRLYNQILALKFRKVPFVCTPRSGAPPIEKFRISKNPLFLLYHFMDRLSLKFIDYIFSASIGELEYLKSVGYTSTKLVRCTGVDMAFCPLDDVTKIRKELGLPLDKKIMLFVGRYNEIKGADISVEAFKELKKKYDVMAIFVGGQKNQPFYQDILESGAKELGYIPRDPSIATEGPTIIKCLNASDVYICPLFNKEINKYCGLSDTVTLSITMNTPVVGSLIMHFNGSKEELSRIGIWAQNREEIVSGIGEVFDHPEKFYNQREIASKYFSWKYIFRLNQKVYEDLFSKYK